MWLIEKVKGLFSKDDKPLETKDLQAEWKELPHMWNVGEKVWLCEYDKVYPTEIIKVERLCDDTFKLNFNNTDCIFLLDENKMYDYKPYVYDSWYRTNIVMYKDIIENYQGIARKVERSIAKCEENISITENSLNEYNAWTDFVNEPNIENFIKYFKWKEIRENNMNKKYEALKKQQETYNEEIERLRMLLVDLMK